MTWICVIPKLECCFVDVFTPASSFVNLQYARSVFIVGVLDKNTQNQGQQHWVLIKRVTLALRWWWCRDNVEAQGGSCAAGAELSAGSALNLAADGLALRARRQLFTWAQVGRRLSSTAHRGNNTVALTTDTVPTTQSLLSFWQTTQRKLYSLIKDHTHTQRRYVSIQVG